jgi:hypothetical protein
MKYFIIILSTFLIACKSNTEIQDEKIKAVISEYVNKNFNDPKSYESIEFSKLDTVMGYPINILRKLDTLRNSIKSFDETQAQIDEIMIGSGISSDHHVYDSIKEIYLSEENALLKSTKVKYYKIDNKYRAKNKMGALVIGISRYVLDSNLVIIDSEEIDERDMHIESTVSEPTISETAVKNINVKFVSMTVSPNGKHRYNFEISNNDIQTFTNDVEIGIFNKLGSGIRSEKFSIVLKPNETTNIKIEASTGFPSEHGDYGITKYGFIVYNGDNSVKEGEGKVQ